MQFYFKDTINFDEYRQIFKINKNTMITEEDDVEVCEPDEDEEDYDEEDDDE